MYTALRLKWQCHIAICHLLTVFLILPVTNALAGQCLKDTRPLDLGGSQNEGAKTIQLRRYLCETSNGDQVSIQFNRLNDLSASLLIHDKVPKVLRPVFANSKIVNNEILAEFNRLLKDFGDYDGDEYFTQINVSSVIGEHAETEQPNMKTKVPVLIPFQYQNISNGFPASVAIIKLESEKTFPSDYIKVSNRLIWRFMKTDDLARYQEMIEAYNNLIARKKDMRYGALGKKDKPKWIDPAIRLYRQLAKSGWPNDFIVILGEHIEEGCDSEHWAFHFFPRELVLDIAVIENVSSHKISIDGLIGNASETTALRSQEFSKALSQGHQNMITSGLGSLAPGEKLVVPTRMTFVIPDGLDQAFKEHPQSLPKMNNYVWGPEMVVTGVKVNSETATLEASAANYLALVTSSGEGSCPYLYNWDANILGWHNQGKIIDKADGPAKEDSEVREFDGLVSRFQIIEQEAELAFINSTTLELELTDGSIKNISLDRHAVTDTDNSYQQLYLGDVLDLDFKVPDDIEPTNVKHSRLKVTGFYRRYGDILSERMGNLNRSKTTIMLKDGFEALPVTNRLEGATKECKSNSRLKSTSMAPVNFLQEPTSSHEDKFPVTP